MASFVRCNYAPVAGTSYDVNWPGPPRRQMTYADVKHSGRS